jgi:hypothetical protein
VIVSSACYAQWLDVGIGNPSSPTASSPAWFGVHDNILFATFPHGISGVNGGLVRYYPPRGWIVMSNGMGATENITSFANVGHDIFAAPESNKVYVSSDSGAHWVHTDVAGPIGSNGTYLLGRLGTSIARSTDIGKTWIRNATLIPTAFFGMDSIFFASTSTGISRSTDSGFTWTATPSPIGNAHFAGMGSVMFAANGTMIKSVDLGATWMTLSIPNHSIGSLAATDSLIFAGTDSGLFISVDSGTHWRVVSGLTAVHGYNPNVTAICVLDTMLFANVEAGSQYGYLMARPIRDILHEAKSAVHQLPLVLDTLLIYPNPLTGLVTIRGSYEIEQVSVMNVLGVDVLEVPSIRTSELTLNLSALPSGTYILRIQTAKGIVLRKIVKE